MGYLPSGGRPITTRRVPPPYDVEASTLYPPPRTDSGM